MFFDRKTTVLCFRFDFYRLNCVFDRKTQFMQKLCSQFDKHVYRPKTHVFRIEKHSFSVINRVYQCQMYNISKNYVFRSIYIVFRDKLCFSSEKLCFSIEKHCLLTKNTLFFANKQCFSIEKHCFSLEKHSLSRKNLVFRGKTQAKFLKT